MLICSTAQEEQTNPRTAKGRNLAAFLISLFDIVPELSKYQKIKATNETFELSIDVQGLLSRTDLNPLTKVVEAKFRAAFVEMLSGFKGTFSNFPSFHSIGRGSFERASQDHARDIEDILADFSVKIIDNAKYGLHGLSGQLVAMSSCLEAISEERLTSLTDGLMGTNLVLEPVEVSKIDGEAKDPPLNEGNAKIQSPLNVQNVIDQSHETSTHEGVSQGRKFNVDEDTKE